MESTEIGAWLGTRELATPDGKRVEVAISVPHFVGEFRWECHVRFTVDGVENLERAGGSDTFQALQSALFIAWRDAEAMGAVWHPLEVDSGFFRTVLTSVPSHFDIPKMNTIIDAELARQEQEAADFYAARERAHAEGRTPAPWPPRMKVWRETLEAARQQEKRERMQAWERDAESPEARELIGSARDAAEAISEGMNCLHAIVNDSTEIESDFPRKLMFALMAVKAGRFPAGDFAVGDDLLANLDQLQRLAPWDGSPESSRPSLRDFAKTIAKHILDVLMRKPDAGA